MKKISGLISLLSIISTSTIVAYANSELKISCAGYVYKSASLITSDANHLKFGDVAIVNIALFTLQDPMSTDEFKIVTYDESQRTYSLAHFNFEGRTNGKIIRKLKINLDGSAVFYNIAEDGKLLAVSSDLKCN